MSIYFSIVIPLYNKQAHIERALDSVFAQTYKHYEIIVIDDGSTDSSYDIVQQVKARRSDVELRIYQQQNAGVAAARNAGVRRAKGHFIAFLDADDSYKPCFLGEIYCLTKKYPHAALFATRYQFVDETAGLTKRANVRYNSPARRGLLSNYFDSASRGDLPIASSAVCIKKYALEAIKGFPEGENMGEDQSVWCDIALRYPIAYSKRVSSNYYQDSENRLMDEMPPKGEMPFSQRLQEALNQGMVPRVMRNAARAYISGHFLDLVRRNYQVQNYAQCQELLSHARSKHQLLRWWYWQLKVTHATLFNKHYAKA